MPPEVAVSNEQWKVVTVNRFNPAQLPFSREKKVTTFTHGASEALLGATEAILQDPTFSLAGTDTSATYLSDDKNLGLSQEQAQMLYQQYPHHLILSLDNIDAFFDQETVKDKENDGTVRKTAHYTLLTRTAWTLYDSTGHVLDRITLSRAEPYDSRGVISGLLAIGPSLVNAGPVINKLAWQTGQDYWQRLHPKKVSFERLYYSNKEFAQAAYSMAANDWESAILRLTPLAENGSRKTAAKAAYNLAVVYEAKGDITNAKQWARESAKKGNKLALLLLPDLAKYNSQINAR
ncbi:MAG: DUF6340 family protein [Pontibacter sp.]|nr:DUF6340 family protein [Pontibacter sp.]